MVYRLSQYCKYFANRLLSRYYKNKFKVEVPNLFVGEAAEEILSIGNHVKEAPILVDVGANVGEYAYLFHKILGCKRVICIEPNNCLNGDIHKNLRDIDYQIINKVVSNYTGEVSFFIHADSLMSSMVEVDKSKYDKLITWDKTENIKEVRLQSITLKEVIDSIEDIGFDIFIKIDTQGNELDVLKSGKDSLRKCRYILVEYMFNTVYQQMFSFNELFQFFVSEGFECHGPTNFYRRGDLSVGAVNFLFVRKN